MESEKQQTVIREIDALLAERQFNLGMYIIHQHFASIYAEAIVRSPSRKLKYLLNNLKNFNKNFSKELFKELNMKGDEYYEQLLLADKVHAKVASMTNEQRNVFIQHLVDSYGEFEEDGLEENDLTTI